MPLPSQKPSFLQLAAVPSVHAFAGSDPVAALVQVPRVVANPHEAHPPAHVVAQQYPCWQRPEAHWAGNVQTVPSGCSEQVPPLQT